MESEYIELEEARKFLSDNFLNAEFKKYVYAVSPPPYTRYELHRATVPDPRYYDALSKLLKQPEYENIFQTDSMSRLIYKTEGRTRMVYWYGEVLLHGKQGKAIHINNDLPSDMFIAMREWLENVYSVFNQVCGLRSCLHQIFCKTHSRVKIKYVYSIWPEIFAVLPRSWKPTNKVKVRRNVRLPEILTDSANAKALREEFNTLATTLLMASDLPNNEEAFKLFYYN
jgi:hypothetical protein